MDAAKKHSLLSRCLQALVLLLLAGTVCAGDERMRVGGPDGVDATKRVGADAGADGPSENNAKLDRSDDTDIGVGSLAGALVDGGLLELDIEQLGSVDVVVPAFEDVAESGVRSDWPIYRRARVAGCEPLFFTGCPAGLESV